MHNYSSSASAEREALSSGSFVIEVPTAELTLAPEVKSRVVVVLAALAYAGQGFHVFPAPPGEKKSHKSAEHSNGARWGATTDEKLIWHDFRKWPKANVGIATGNASGFFVVEADTPEGHDVDGIGSLRDLEARYGKLPETRMAISPSGSLHYYLRMPAGVAIKNSASEIAPGVDVRADGGMVIAPPSVKPGVGAYRWLNQSPIVDAPPWLIELIKVGKAETKAGPKTAMPTWLAELVAGDAGKGLSTDEEDSWAPVTKATISAALAVIDPDCDRGAWFSIGCTLFNALGDGGGFEVWNTWSFADGKSKKYPGPHAMAEQWQSIVRRGYSYSIATLFFYAKEADPNWRDKIEEPPPEEPAATSDPDRAESPDVGAIVSKDTVSEQKQAAEPSPQAADAGLDPVDLWGKFAPPELPQGLLPKRIESFARIESINMGTDPAGLAMAALAVCAAAIPDRIKLRVKEHDKYWAESARLWTVLVGDPSTKKSPILSQAAWPLGKIDRRLTADYFADKATYDELSAEQKKSHESPRHPRVKLEDTTIEAAQEVLRDSPDGVLRLDDELSGFFGAMDKYSGRGSGADRAFWMRAYNGGEATFHRIARGSGLIPNLSVSMLGGIQPDLIRKVATDGIEDGLLQRFLFVVLRPAEVDQDKPHDPVVDDYRMLVDQLHQMRLPQDPGFTEPGERPFEDTVLLHFDKAAQAIRNQLAKKHVELMGTESVNRKLAAHIGKYDGVFARLCVLWHCIENVERRPLPLIVTEDTARRVAAFLHDFIFRHAVVFYAGTLGLADDHDRLANVASYVLAKKLAKVTNRDVQRGDRSMRRLADGDINRIFEQLEALGWLERALRRPPAKARWNVNPLVHVRFADRAKREADRRAQGRDEIREAIREATAKEAT